MMISCTRLESKALVDAAARWCPMKLACVFFRPFIEGVLSRTAVVSPLPLSFTPPPYLYPAGKCFRIACHPRHVILWYKDTLYV